MAEAQRWLEDIFEYIAANNPRAAAQTVNGIYERAQVQGCYLDSCGGMKYRHTGR